VPAHLAELKAHEGVRRCGDFVDNGLDLVQGDTKLGAQFDGKAGKVGPGFDVQVVEKNLESSSWNGNAAKETEHECCYHCREDASLHTDPFSFLKIQFSPSTSENRSMG
jgi:hypothetical protein